MQLGLHVSYLFQLNVCAFLVKVVNCKCYENANFYGSCIPVCAVGLPSWVKQRPAVLAWTPQPPALEKIQRHSTWKAPVVYINTYLCVALL